MTAVFSVAGACASRTSHLYDTSKWLCLARILGRLGKRNRSSDIWLCFIEILESHCHERIEQHRLCVIFMSVGIANQYHSLHSCLPTELLINLFPYFYWWAILFLEYVRWLLIYSYLTLSPLFLRLPVCLHYFLPISLSVSAIFLHLSVCLSVVAAAFLSVYLSVAAVLSIFFSYPFFWCHNTVNA